MTRAFIYGGSLATVVLSIVLSIVAIAIPRWVSFRDTTPGGDKITYTYGLHQRCSSSTGVCTPFPTAEDCHGSDRYFCSVWRSIGFLMNFAVVLEAVIIVGFCAVLWGGRQKRERGWQVMSVLLLIVALTQCTVMALIAYLYDWDERFFVGWRLDVSWIITTVSWCIVFMNAVSLALSGFLLPPEDGYELIKP